MQIDFSLMAAFRPTVYITDVLLNLLWLWLVWFLRFAISDDLKIRKKIEDGVK